MDNIYETAEAMVRERLAARRRDFVERCVILALWILRQHGPHGFREFPLDRRALGGGKEAESDHKPVAGSSECFKVEGKPRLTSPQIRTATEALLAIGVIVKTMEQRRQYAKRYYANVYCIGMEFAVLFSQTKDCAPQAHPRDAVRSTLNRNSPINSPINETDLVRTPLVRATSQSRLPRPFQRRPQPKSEEDLHEAHLEALRIRMTATPVALSPEAARSVLDPGYRFGLPRQPGYGGGWQPGGGVPSTLGTAPNATLGPHRTSR
jgi:hypothetical protein